MRYFITGGAGFIGSTMVDALIDSDDVTVFDNFTSGQRAFLAHHASNPRLRVVEGELGDLPTVIDAMAGCDVVFHFASNPDIARGMTDTRLDIDQGTLLTYNVLEAMRRTGTGTILFSSGSGVYGDVGTTPTAEAFGPLLPISLYGASKLACEGLISAYCGMFDLRGYIFRFANVVGQRQTHGVGYDFVRRLRANPRELRILGDGTQSKAYIHVSDVVAAMLFVYRTCTERIHLYNVATDDYIDVNTIADITMAEMGLRDVERQYTGGDRGWKGDVPVMRFDIAKIHALGWTARHTSAEAIRRSIREMLELG